MNRTPTIIIMAAAVSIVLFLMLSTPSLPSSPSSVAVSESCPLCSTVDVNDKSGPNPEILPIYQSASDNSGNIVCKLANQNDFNQDWFKNQLREYPTAKNILHRKIWELTYIGHIANKLNVCSKGKKALVWAAGTEILVSYFAGKGCEVLATDMDAEGATKKGWSNTNQHAVNKDSLFLEQYIKKEDFDKLVDYRTQNMNHVPVDTRNSYDFMWSTCSMEHVGSILLGQRFVLNSMDLLKPGGIAIHTVEFTLSSNEKTLLSGDTVLWRKRDVEELITSLQVMGYEVFPVTWGAGDGKLDKEPDLPPYSQNAHLKVAFAEHVVTSFAFIIKKPETWKSGVSAQEFECSH